MGGLAIITENISNLETVIPSTIANRAKTMLLPTGIHLLV